MLTVINGTEKKKPNYAIMHITSLTKAIINYHSKNDRTDLYKIVFHGIKAVVMSKDNSDSTNIQERYDFIRLVREYTSLLTPSELMRIFPIEKTYDGARWETKDYFYVIESLKKHGLNTTIGENLDNLLWDYMNTSINMFLVRVMSVVSDLYKAQTGTDWFKEFCEDNGITTYNMATDSKTGKQYMINKDTGERQRVYKPIPRHLKIIPGGSAL